MYNTRLMDPGERSEAAFEARLDRLASEIKQRDGCTWVEAERLALRQMEHDEEERYGV